MKRFSVADLVTVLVPVGLVASAASTADAADPRLERLALDVVHTSATIEPGDVVVVSGGKHTVELMEAVAAEAWKVGGVPTMFLNTDRASRARFAEMPEKYLGQKPTYFAEWLKQIDVWISVPASEDPKAVWGDIPEERFAKSSKAGQFIRDMLNDAKVRLVSIGYPTRENAAINGIDFSTYEAMHWKAVNTDYRKIAQRGNYLKTVLQGAKTVKVTSPSGTNLSFKVGDRPIFVDDGIVTKQEATAKHFLTRIASLPGGSLFFAPIESSANGRVVIPKDRCRFDPLTQVSFEFSNGRLQNFRATRGKACFEETMAPYSGPKDMFASVAIGLNPEWKVIEDPGDFRPEDAAGMVTINIGNNQLLGGENRSTGGFSFPIVNATVEIDGRVVVKDGKLTF